MSRKQVNTSGSKAADSLPQFSDAEDDPIVHEIDVYLSQELSGNLHILQYPLRPHDRPYTDVGPIVAARAKPKLRKLELEFQMDDSPSKYDAEAEHEFPRLKLTSQTVPPKTNYAIGLFRENRLYLTPLNAICKMVPSFAHVDQANEDYREMEREARGEAAAEAEQQDDLKPVLQKFKRQNDRTTTMKKVTYSYLKLLQEQEPWAELEIVPYDDYESTLHRDLLTMVTPTAPLEPITSASEYLDRVCPKGDLFQVENDALEIKDPRTLRNNKLVEFIKFAHVASLSHICRVLEIKTVDELRECLEILNTYFYNVQGNWVLRSEHCFPGRSTVSVRRILTRNVVICHFARSMVIARADIVKMYPVSLDDLNLVLKDLAVPCGEAPDPETHWRLKQPRDEDFIRRNGALVERHLGVIERLRQMIVDILAQREAHMQQEQQQQQQAQSQSRR